MADHQGKTSSDRTTRSGKEITRTVATGKYVKRDVSASNASRIISAAASGKSWAVGERKTNRLTARLTPDQDAIIRYAAEIAGTDLTNFTITTLLARAFDILADRKLFVLDDAAWTQFNAMLDAPVSHKPRLEKLFSEPTIFDTRPET